MIQQFYFWEFTQRKTLIQKDMCTPMSLVALFTIARIWKESVKSWIQLSD